MADIDIQKKKRSPWPWILGLLGLVLVVWVAAEMMGDDDDQDDYVATDATEQPASSATVDEAAMPAAVTQFETECAARSTTTDEMSLDHTYEEDCIRQMTAAFDAVIERDTVNNAPLAQQLDDYRARAEQLTENRDSPRHSEHLRSVFEGAAALVVRIEDTRENAGEALERRSDRVTDAAEAFSADEPVMEQRDEVAAFFRETSAALRAMAASAGKS